ncbi:ATP-binding cassette domain-containing protein [Nonomuraea sp. NPDC050328]|uniref:ABC transporter ATP-binding protein n=1 Tax=Nonomuraea sp. NPDC050328 TaxID=3364361 RepID=UPI0037AB7ABF
MIEAEGLGLRKHGRWIFRDLSLVAPAGFLVAVVGPSDSGRSSFLLALAGRMKVTTGRLTVDGVRAVRKKVAVARVRPPIDLTPELRVGEHARERRWLEGVGPHAFDDACEALGWRAPAREPVEELDAADRTLLCAALGLMAGKPVVVLDDVHENTASARQREVWRALRRACDTGATIVASTVEEAPAYALADGWVRCARP